jgi:hypothetical protein
MMFLSLSRENRKEQCNFEVAGPVIERRGPDEAVKLSRLRYPEK